MHYKTRSKKLQSCNLLLKSLASLERRTWEGKDCYDWKTLVDKGELDTLKVPELDKYIEHNKLNKKGKKNRQNQANHSTLLWNFKGIYISFKRQCWWGQWWEWQWQWPCFVWWKWKRKWIRWWQSYCNNTRRHINKKWPQSRTLVHKICWFRPVNRNSLRGIDWRGLGVGQLLYKVICGWVKN